MLNWHLSTYFMWIFYGFTFLLSLLYASIIGRYIYFWNKIPIWNIPSGFVPSTSISVIIAARNEALNIENCLNSILSQHYPKSLLEILVIDDFSTDDTASIVQNRYAPTTQLIQLANFSELSADNSGKKQAISIGIMQARGNLIITTDADCIAPNNWLMLMSSFYENKPYKFIAAPVNFYKENNLLERFQSLDFLGMMLLTGAGIEGRFMNMCNGANLAYEKKLFEEVDGFEGINELASGDDMLLQQKIAQQYPDAIGYLKNRNATILTTAKTTIRSFLNQRIRWASKTGAYMEWQLSAILSVVFFLCWSILLLLFCTPFFKQAAIIFIIIIIIKGISDYIFLKKAAHFFKRKDLLAFFIPSFFIHIIYISLVGILGNIIKKYHWKGRKVK